MDIGQFNKDGEGYAGALETLTFTKPATLEPVTNKSREKSPDFRLFTGDREIGAAWEKTSKDGNAYLSVTIDDPAFPDSINCRLVKTGIENAYTLKWNRERE